MNEATFRAANEAIVKNVGRAGLASGEPLPLICECGSADCLATIRVTLPEYALVRKHRARFAVKGGHENGDETVIDEFDRFTVVEKTGAGRDVVRGAGSIRW
jgi:hypothetical protein